MTTPVWQAGTLYVPGSLVQPASAPAPTPVPVANGGFEDGDVDWSLASGFSIGQFGNGTHFQGTWSLQWDLGSNGRAINSEACPVVAGQVINANCQVQQGASSSGAAGARAEVAWYDASDNLISFSSGNLVSSGSNQQWKQSSVSATAPANAAFARFSVFAFRNSGSDELWIDNCTWDATVNTLPTGLVFRAVQALAGYSGATEPVWPLINGQQVVDNEVTWEAVFASRVIWEATPILVSGSYEPDWPSVPNATVADGTVKWVAMPARVEDPKCPNSKIGAAAASKVFAADEDIIAFSATTNPLDWSSEADAGYLPFGLNTYGSTPVAAMGLYRGNLVAFNDSGYQMWQVDEDPANMALLDASPVDCVYRKSIQAVMNDLAFLSSQGVRNIGIAGASASLQAGAFGKQVDPLVLAKIREGLAPISLFYPGAGQYWLIFDEEAFVLTINGSKDQSWSRYIFPYPITDWAILDGDLYLRAGDLVWKFDEEAGGADDVVCAPPTPDFDTALEASGVPESSDGGTFTAPASWGFGASDFSFETWCNRSLPGGTGFGTLLRARGNGGAASGWEVQIRGTAGARTIRLVLRPVSTSFNFDSPAFNLPDDTWGHIAVTVNKATNTATFYFNGVSIGTADVTTGDGAVGTAGSGRIIMENCLGSVDEMRVWTKVLTPEEVLANYQYPYQDLEDTTGCIAAFQFNETAAPGDPVIDTVGGVVLTPEVGTAYVDGPTPPGSGGGEEVCDEGIPFEGYIAWPYLDFGTFGLNKMLDSIDVTATGTFTVSVGYDQSNFALATEVYSILGDTLPGTPIPMPVSGPSFQLRLTFEGGQTWEWMASNMYLANMRIA